jgi:hypothetical protein
MILILPAIALTFPASRAFTQAGYDDHWRRLVVIIFGLTFPAWIIMVHTLTYFGLAAAGLRPWNINRQNLILPEHLALTALAAGVISALALGWLARSWFLLGVGMFSGVVLAALTWLGEAATMVGIVFWLGATAVALKAWAIERQRAGVRAGLRAPEAGDQAS